MIILSYFSRCNLGFINTLKGLGFREKLNPFKVFIKPALHLEKYLKSAFLIISPDVMQVL